MQSAVAFFDHGWMDKTAFVKMEISFSMGIDRGASVTLMKKKVKVEEL